MSKEKIRTSENLVPFFHQCVWVRSGMKLVNWVRLFDGQSWEKGPTFYADGVWRRRGDKASEASGRNTTAAEE